MENAHRLGLPCRIVADCGGDAIVLPGEPPIALADLRRAHESWLPEYMN
jgi:phosphoribosylformylglycinamidine synthase